MVGWQAEKCNTVTLQTQLWFGFGNKSTLVKVKILRQGHSDPKNVHSCECNVDYCHLEGISSKCPHDTLKLCESIWCPLELKDELIKFLWS